MDDGRFWRVLPGHDATPRKVNRLDWEVFGASKQPHQRFGRGVGLIRKGVIIAQSSTWEQALV